ncbi:hypothetical protein ABZ863_11195 [Saccharomonospora sp. NPDC046836]|uniref:hypothetical protein n=1 Tax=Saccharomonospora sp. NPDC046836 TaxID=3156921 RepID=UPI00340604C4
MREPPTTSQPPTPSSTTNQEEFSVPPTNHQCLRIADALLDDNVAQAEVFLWAAWHPLAEFPDEDYSLEEQAWAASVRALRRPPDQDPDSARTRLDDAIRAETTNLLLRDHSAAREALRLVGAHLVTRGHTVLIAAEPRP